MRSPTRFSKGIVAALLAAGAGLGLSACGDYAIFKVHVGATSPRDDIEECRMTIADENGKCVILNVLLLQVAGAPGSPLKQGCAGGNLTPPDVGFFSYSTSRSSGTFTFTVEALNSSGNVVESKSNGANVAAYPPEVPVELPMTRSPEPTKPPPPKCCPAGGAPGVTPGC
jgi:hypothetical protein